MVNPTSCSFWSANSGPTQGRFLPIKKAPYRNDTGLLHIATTGSLQKLMPALLSATFSWLTPRSVLKHHAQTATYFFISLHDIAEILTEAILIQFLAVVFVPDPTAIR